MKKGFKFNSEQLKVRNEKRKKTTLEKYGVEHISQLEETKRKKRETCLKHFGTEIPFKSEVVKEKIQQTNLKKYGTISHNQEEGVKEKKKITCLKKYGVENPLMASTVKLKSKKTSLEKYGVFHPMQSPQIRSKVEKTNLKKYGFKCSLQNFEVKEKIKNTLLKKYGVESPLQSNTIKEKVKRTNLEKYDVDNVFKLPHIREKAKNTILERYGVDNISKSESVKIKKKEQQFKKFFEYMNNFLKKINLMIISPYTGEFEHSVFKCLECGCQFETNWSYIQQGKRCPECFPKDVGVSICEIELAETLQKHIKIDTSRRDIIPPKEIDIYIPSKKIAIEFDGLYWHSEKLGKDKNYHLNKTLECEKQGIQLIHIFEDEWIYKQDIVKNRLKQILGVSDARRIHARKCKIKEIDAKVKNEFLERYHIQGKDFSVVKLGAFYDNELVSVMTFSHGNITKGSKSEKDIWELNRFCSDFNYHIPGIASKLLTYFKRNYEWKEIFSYADRRWSVGGVYKKLGFELDHATSPNYWYIDFAIVKRIYRFNLRKRPDEPKEITEQELRLREGYQRIWDCGNLKYRMVNLKY